MLKRWIERLLARLEPRWRSWFGTGRARADDGMDPLISMAPALTGPLSSPVSVVIPALNEAQRIASVVTYALSDPACGEVIVIDDSSIDDTANLARGAGARVITSSMLGKGASMHDGLREARHDVVVYLDGDLSSLRPGIVSDLARPIERGVADFVKARFGRGGGRVTELTAKPMLKVFFPELANIAQPLGGIVAGRRALLNNLRFEDGYGVDVALLIDAHRSGARVVEVDIGKIEHDSQALQDLAAMANEVARTIFLRAREVGRLNVDQIVAMYETQRQATSSIDYVLSRRRQRSRLALLPLDGVVCPNGYLADLAASQQVEPAFRALIDEHPRIDETRRQALGALFRFVHRNQFEALARRIAVRDGAVELVNRLRRAGFMVGIVSNAYFVGAEIVRRRVFADFAIADTLQFENDVSTGGVRINPAFLPPANEPSAPIGPRHLIDRFRDRAGSSGFSTIWAVGMAPDDLDWLTCADRGFALRDGADPRAWPAGVQALGGLEELHAALDELIEPALT